MSYDKTFIDDSGEEFPYCASIDSDGYHYRVSVVFGDLDGELNILDEGVHIEFDKDGSWLDFNLKPMDWFPGQKELSHADILKIMSEISSGAVISKRYSGEEMDRFYEKFKKQRA